MTELFDYINKYLLDTIKAILLVTLLLVALIYPYEGRKR